MTMDDTDLRAVLHRATGDLAASPTLLEDVRRGGRRRLMRRRTVLAAGLAVVAAASTAGVVGLRGDGGGPPLDVASPYLDDPTRGDLANDAAYLDQVRDLWRRQNADLGFTGEIHVVWAGNTPAGPAAYVAQRTMANPVVVEPDGWRMIAMAAFVEPTARGPQLGTVGTVTDAQTELSAATLLGPDRDVLLVLDGGYPVEFSPTMTYTADGRIQRDFQPVVFRNGAAALRVPPQRTKVTISVSRTPVSMDNVIIPENTSEVLFPGGKDRPAPPLYTHTLPGAAHVWGSDPEATQWKYAGETGALDDYIDVSSGHTHNGTPLLTVYGVTPDGRRLLITSIQYDDDPTRVIALLARGDTPFKAVASGFVDWKEPLPVRLRLPDRQGTLVAAEGAALAYRIGNGDWEEAGRDAALLPATATHARVTAATGAPAVVSLR